jgi:hypothetical protein
MGGSFFGYYRRLLRVFALELWATWRAEAWPAMLIAIVFFIRTRSEDFNAWKTLVYTVESAAIYLAGWGIYHLVRAPWKLDGERKPEPVVSIRQATIALSNQILEFVYSRLQTAPKITTPEPRFPALGGGTEWLQSMMEYAREQRTIATYERDTLGLYDVRYKRPVAETVTSLKSVGLDTSGLEQCTGDLSNESEPEHAVGPRVSIPIHECIKAVGINLGILADQIEES